MSYKAGTVVIDIKADTAKLVTGMDKASSSVKKSVDSIKRAVVGMAAAYAGVQSVRAFGNMISDSLDAADATGKLAQKLGLTTDALSEFQYAAGFAAVSNSELSAGLGALIRRLNNFKINGGGAAKKGFEALGISSEYARKNFTSTDKAFIEILKRLEKMPDGFKKTAVAQDIFSKSASSILRITSSDLKKFSEEARQIGISIPQAVYEMSAAYHDQMDQLNARMKGIKQTVAFSVVAPMNAASKTAVDMYDAMFSDPIDKMTYFEDAAVTIIGNVAYSVGFIKDAFTGVELVIKSLELIFYGFASGVSLALEPVRKSINDMIGAYNYIQKELGNDTFDFELKSNLPNNIAKTKELALEIADLTQQLENGRITAAEFTSNFKSNLTQIKEKASEAKNEIKSSTDETISIDFSKLDTSILDEYSFKEWLKQEEAKQAKIKETADLQKSLLASATDLITSDTEKINARYMEMYDVIDGVFDEDQMKKFFKSWGDSLADVNKEASKYEGIGSQAWTAGLKGQAKDFANISNAVQDLTKDQSKYNKLSEEDKALNKVAYIESQANGYAALAGAMSESMKKVQARQKHFRGFRQH